MKQYIYISLLLLAGCLCACQEEDLNLADLENVFLPSPNATDESSELRRNFYEATGCYLLFNDTLRHEYGGVDAYGNPYYDTELLSLGWNYISGSSNPTRYVYEYIETIELRDWERMRPVRLASTAERKRMSHQNQNPNPMPMTVFPTRIKSRVWISDTPPR